MLKNIDFIGMQGIDLGYGRQREKDRNSYREEVV